MNEVDRLMRLLGEIKLLRMRKMVELKINTKYRVMGLPENVGRIENGDIVETTDIVQNLPFVGVVGVTHPESAWIKKTFLFEMEKKPNNCFNLTLRAG